jgi:hypothetical protein
MCGVEPTEAAVFFGDHAIKMLECPANFGPNSNKSKKTELKRDVWLMRGFYPNTPQMFKISIAQNDAFSYGFEYYVKVTEPAVRVPSAKSKRGLDFTVRYESSLTSDQIRDELQERLEKEVLGLDIQSNKLISEKVVFTPKCISPKGMPIYRLSTKKE